MAYSFVFKVGGKTDTDAATDYTQQVIRSSYDKNFCGKFIFDMVIEVSAQAGATAALRTATTVDNNVFYMINDGSADWLLFKGEIEDVIWTSRKRCKITGLESMRKESGGVGHLHQTKTPQWTRIGEFTREDALNDTTWFDNSKSWFDGGDTGEDGLFRKK